MYLIEILHQTTTCGKCEDCLRRCILSKFYIKPQLAIDNPHLAQSCILSKFYIKPQLISSIIAALASCILSKFYIKPQRHRPNSIQDEVVSYRNSTSNHNIIASDIEGTGVVSYRNSTSNHNWSIKHLQPVWLYLIEILHQTTTFRKSSWIAEGLYLIEILHQTTTVRRTLLIKPLLYLIEILHQTTTCTPVAYGSLCCILSKFYIKPQPFCESSWIAEGCILSKFYIKPQRLAGEGYPQAVVSYRNSTSNHNHAAVPPRNAELYLIEILHQTTTRLDRNSSIQSCILSKFYIKPQLARQWLMVPCGCILSKFYIKPQRSFPLNF